MADVISYADKNYQRKKALYDILAQSLENIKYGASSSGHRWNKPVQEVQGITIRLIGTEHLQLTYHRYEIGTLDEMMMREQNENGLSFIKEVEKALKKEFKSISGKTLDLKRVEHKSSPEHVSSYATRPHARFLVRDSALYEFSATL
jgi:hypothetical protein